MKLKKKIREKINCMKCGSKSYAIGTDTLSDCYTLRCRRCNAVWKFTCTAAYGLK